MLKTFCSFNSRFRSPPPSPPFRSLEFGQSGYFTNHVLNRLLYCNAQSIERVHRCYSSTPLPPHQKEAVSYPNEDDGKLVATLDQKLSSFQNQQKFSEDNVKDKEKELFARQLKIEEEQHSEALCNYTEVLDGLLKLGKGTSMNAVKKQLLTWYEPLTKAMIEEIKLIGDGDKSDQRPLIGPYLLILPVEKLSVITLDTTLNLILQSGNAGVHLMKAAASIGDLLEAEFNIQKMRCRNKKVSPLPNWQRKILADPTKDTNSIKNLNKKLRKINQEEEWDKSMKVKVGVKLIKLLLDSAITKDGRPVFIHTVGYKYIKRLNKQLGLVRLDEGTYDHICNNSKMLIMPRFLPMLVPPKAWDHRSFYGAYYSQKAPIMRTMMKEQNEAVRRSDMQRVVEGLNFLGNIPWQISNDVYAVVTTLIGSGQSLGEIPSATDLPLPDKEDPAFWRLSSEIEARRTQQIGKTMIKKKASATPTDTAVIENIDEHTYRDETMDTQVNVNSSSSSAVISSNVDNRNDISPTNVVRGSSYSSSDLSSGGVGSTEPEEEQKVFDQEYYDGISRRVKKKNLELHSLRCDLTIKLKVAEKFLNDTIYFPSNLDFRGRAYPVPPNLSHLGSDLCRGLLLFAEAKELGEEGLDWLKIHLANLYGNNKIDLEERVAWVDQHMDDIYDSARNPLGGGKWWVEAESPFQALSAMFEIVKAIESGDPVRYKCPLPVHQDGSCNGLQHYAGLGRDEKGGVAVNLVSADKPQDVYSEVLAIVLQEIEKDVKESVNDPIDAVAHRASVARLVHGIVDRKVIKQTVMTSVYGVTKSGARAQIQARLEEKVLHGGINMILSPEQEDRVFQGSGYVSELTLFSLGQIFSRAQEIMNWLTVCSVLVSKQQQPMAWVTPLGLPVVQPYRVDHKFRIVTVLQKITLTVDEEYLPISTRKQKSAFPPNFVHSLDASHMLLTSLRMRDLGLTFATVHDSYWTHACDVPIMSQQLRECFVELYKYPVLEDLRETLIMRFPEADFPPVPYRGELDIAEVLKSKFFFH